MEMSEEVKNETTALVIDDEKDYDNHVSRAENTKKPNQEENKLFSFIQERDNNKFEVIYKKLTKIGRKLDILDERNWTLLQNACYHGNAQIVKFLLNQEVSLDCTKQSDSPLLLACRKGHVEVIKSLEQKHPSTKPSLLHYLVQSDVDTKAYSEYVKQNITSSSLEVKDSLERTPLYYALICECENRVLELLNAGACIDTADDRGQTPINLIDEHTMTKYLDSLVTTNGKPPNDEGFEIILDYSNMLRQNNTEKEKNKGYVFPTEVLNGIKRERHLRKCLRHPILSFIIFAKRPLITGMVNVTSFLYALFGISLTTYVLLGTSNISSSTAISVAHLTSSITLILLCINEIFYFITEKVIYIKSLDSIVRLITLFFCAAHLILRCSSHGKDAESAICQHISPFAMLTAWCEFFFILGKVPSLNFYIKIFRRAFLIMVKFLFIHIPLIIGFALTFHVLFQNSTEQSKEFAPNFYVLFHNGTEQSNDFVPTFQVLLQNGTEQTKEFAPTCHVLLQNGTEQSKDFIPTFYVLFQNGTEQSKDFALTFQVLFQNGTEQSNGTPFSDVFKSIFRTMIMFTSELNSDSIPFQNLPITSHLIFIAFIFTIGVVLFNLLIGLASATTTDIEENSYLYDCKTQVFLIYRFEQTYFSTKNFAQKMLHNYLWSFLCRGIFWVFIGESDVIKQKKDCKVRIKLNDKNKKNEYFIFKYEENKGIIAVKRNKKVGRVRRFFYLDYELPKEVVDEVKKIIKERRLKENSEEDKIQKILDSDQG